MWEAMCVKDFDWCVFFLAAGGLRFFIRLMESMSWVLSMVALGLSMVALVICKVNVSFELVVMGGGEWFVCLVALCVSLVALDVGSFLMGVRAL